MLARDLDSVDRVLRLAFGTIRGLADPASAFGDGDLARTRFRASPDAAWVAELEGDVVGSVFAAQWGTFGFLGPLSVDPALWDRGIGSRLLLPVLDAFGRWDLRQAGLFTFAGSPKHLGLYQKHGFWPGALIAVMAKSTDPHARTEYALASKGREHPSDHVLDEIQGLTELVFPGLDLGLEIVAARAQDIGETILLRRGATVDGMAVCHCGAGSEAGSDTCYVKFAAARPGDGAAARFERLLDACDAFAADSGLGRLVAGVNTARLDAYRRLLGRGFAVQQVGVSMWLQPGEARFDTPEHYVIDDLR
jgi:predicted N-acetyltransferase YhbS